MPIWGSDDNYQDKPRFPQERQVREVIQLTVGTKTTVGVGLSNTITFTGVGAATAANVGVVPGMYVFDASMNVSYYGDDKGKTDFFFSNNTVLSVSGNVVTLSANVIGNIEVGQTVDFCNAISWGLTQGAASGKPVEKTYNSDTILVTATRASNVLSGTANVAPGISANQIGSLSTGWVHVQKKTNADGTVRYLKETLVALANPTAANTGSGNTSFGYFLSGV